MNVSASFISINEQNLNSLKNDISKMILDDLKWDSDSQLTHPKISEPMFYDIKSIHSMKDIILKSKIVILLISIKNKNSFNFLDEKLFKEFSDMIQNENQQKTVIGRTMEDYNPNECIPKIIETMNFIKCNKYFEEKNGRFSFIERQNDQLTILPNFYEYFFIQMKNIIDNKFDVDKKTEYTTSNYINLILSEKNRTAEIVYSPYVSGDVIIPEFIRENNTNYEIRSIADNAFKNTSIRSLSFENSHVIQMGNCVFANSTIERIIIPESIELIGEKFGKKVDYLKEIEVDQKNKHFIYKQGLLISIDENKIICAQRNISGIVIIPKEIKKIDQYAFYNCNYMTNFIINSGSFEELGYKSFYNFDNLKTFSISNANKLNIGDFCFSKSSKLFYFSIQCKELKIGKNCFENCSSLKKILFNQIEVIQIGIHAFKCCNEIDSFDVKDAISVELNEECFLNCNTLQQICICSQNLNFSNNSFENCSNINHITINTSKDMNITGNLFENVKLIKSIRLCSSSRIILSNGCFSDLNLDIIELNAKNLFFDENCFNNHQNLISISIKCNNNITISSNTFIGCDSLNSIHIESNNDLQLSKKSFNELNVRCIELSGNDVIFDNESIINCKNLEKMKINVKSKLNYAVNCFKGIDNLKEVEFHGGDIIIQDKIFNCCRSLKSLVFLNVNSVIIDNEQFLNCKQIESIKIQSKVNIHIGGYCFKNLPKLSSVSLSSGFILLGNG